ncbi:MAG TPA: hypothetical protein VFS83_03440 [Ktedonobacterales bacterium]|nr:hypothetical protein [Ktedonobacterales bacterium]
MPTLPSQPSTFGALQAMQSLILNECLVAGVSPFATLSASDATRYGVARAVYIGRPKDFSDAYLPQCCIWLPSDTNAETVDLVGYAGRARSSFAARVLLLVDQRTDWYAAEQQILTLRDALWPVLLRHAQLGGAVASVTASEAFVGRGLCYEQIAGVQYRCFEATWRVHQQWQVSGGMIE